MRKIYVRVISVACTQCLEALLTDLQSKGLPRPIGQIGEIIYIPEEWLLHEYPHTEGGIVLRVCRDHVDEDDTAEDDDNDDVPIDNPFSPQNLDATKGIGYPVREEGRYGSHPAHDAFGDESEP